MDSRIPIPTVQRLSIMQTLLDRLIASGRQTISSAELGKLMDVPAHTVRKDINFLGQAGGKYGYEISVLKEKIEQGMFFYTDRKVCIVGLGRLGTSIMDYTGFEDGNLSIEAGFDSSINRIETLKTNIPLYPAYRIPEIVESKGIDIGVIAVPAHSAEITAKRLMEGGIRGIINFAPAVIKCSNDAVIIRNMHLMEEFRIVSSLIGMKEKTKRREDHL